MTGALWDSVIRDGLPNCEVGTFRHCSQGGGRQKEGPYGPGGEGQERGTGLLCGPRKGALMEEKRSVKLYFNV